MTRKNAVRGATVIATVPGGAGPSRLMTASWVLLLAALVTPLLTDSPRWFGMSRPFFRFGPYLFQAYAAQILVMGALACFAVALWTRTSALRWHPALGLVLGLLAWTLVTTVLSPAPASAVLGDPINSQGLLLRIVATAVLLLTVAMVDGTARIRSVARVLGLVGAVAAVVGLLQVAGVNPLGASAVWGAGRSFGTLGNPDMFGGFILLALFTSLGVALSEKAPAWRIVMWTATALCATSAVTSYSRAAWIGAVVGAVTFALLAWRARLGVDRGPVLAVVAVVLAVVAVMALRPSTPGASTDLAHRIESAVSTTDADSAVRLEIWASAFRAIALRPIQGYGPDTMAIASEPVRSERLARLVDPRLVMESAHSIPIQTMSDLGIPGFLLWAGMLAAVAVVALRSVVRGPEGSSRGRLVMAGLWAACAAFLADSLFTPSSVAGTLFLFCMLGLLLAPSAAGRALADRGPRRVAAGALGAVAVAGVVIAVLFLAADLQAAVAKDEGLAGPPRIDAAARAIRLNPLSVDYAMIDSSILIDKARSDGAAGAGPDRVRPLFDQALAEARRAVSIEPTNQRRRVFMAGILLVGGKYLDSALNTQALAEMATAVTMSPNDLSTQCTYAQVLPIVDPAQAKTILRRILTLRPGYAPAAVALSGIDVASGDAEAARGVLRAALADPQDKADRASLESALAEIP